MNTTHDEIHVVPIDSLRSAQYVAKAQGMTKADWTYIETDEQLHSTKFKTGKTYYIHNSVSTTEVIERITQ